MKNDTPYITTIPKYALDKYLSKDKNVNLLTLIKNIIEVEKTNIFNELDSDLMLNDVDADRWNYNRRRLYCACQLMANEIFNLRRRLKEYEERT